MSAQAIYIASSGMRAIFIAKYDVHKQGAGPQGVSSACVHPTTSPARHYSQAALGGRHVLRCGIPSQLALQGEATPTFHCRNETRPTELPNGTGQARGVPPKSMPSDRQQEN